MNDKGSEVRSSDPIAVAGLLLELQQQGVLPPMRIESFGDQIVMLAAPRWEHNKIVSLVIKHVATNSELTWLTGQDVVLPDGGEPIPDLVVLAADPEPGTTPLAGDTELLVEVVSMSNHRNDYTAKYTRYAEAGVPEYLLVDPREGVCVRLRQPQPAARDWELRAEFKFGDAIDLLCTPGHLLDTGNFLRY